MAYIIGVSSGLWGIARQRGGQESLAHLGIYRKAMQAITKGINFIQIDIDNISEFQEIDLKRKMEDVRRMGIEYGFHAESAATLGGRAEYVLMDSSIEEDYLLTHNRIEQTISRVGEINGKYIVYHASESPGFLEMGREFKSTRVVSFDGTPLHEFMEKLNKDVKEKLENWIVRKPYIMEIVSYLLDPFREPNFDEFVKRMMERLKKRGGTGIDEIDDEFSKRYRKALEEKRKKDPNATELTEEEREKIVNEMKNFIENETKKTFVEAIYSFSRRSELHYGTERLPYYIIAKYMEITKDPLWKNVVDASIKYFSKLEGKTTDEWLKSRKIKNISMDDDNFVKEYKIWIPAVAAKYIWGHFNRDNGKLKNLAKKYNIIIAFETAMGEEERMRLANPLHLYYLVKELGENFSIALDLEHILGANINPEIALDLLPEDAGKFIRLIHTGHPSPLQPAHLRIGLGSEEQIYLYKVYYKLRKRGMGVENDCYIIFERGEETEFQESIQALRLIKEFLEKDVEPEIASRDPKFFGFDIGEFKSLERQRAIIREHAFDPLAGLIVAREETHGELGRLALEKGKRPEEWLKERYK